MMVFEVGETVRHCLISAEDRARPPGFACAFNGYLSRQRIELSIRDQLGSDRTVSELRCGEIEVVSLLEAMIRELIAGCHPKPPRYTRRVDKVDACHLRLLPTVLGIGRHDQRLEMAAQNTAGPLVEPLRRNTHSALRRAATIDAPLIHKHAVSRRSALRVHSLTICRAALVC
jgi:hypothetical protein